VQIENASALFFERGSQLALVHSLAGACAVLRGKLSPFGARLRFASAPQINYVGHRPLSSSHPLTRRFLLFPFASTAQNITDNNLLRKGQFARFRMVVI
jgi:hypothetical protein